MGTTRETDKKGTWWLLWLLPAFLIVVFMLRLGGILRFLLPFLAIAGAFGYGLVWLVGVLSKTRLKKGLEEQVAEKLSFCRAERASMVAAMEEITQHLRELEARANASGIDPAAREKLRRLVEAYRVEYQLRLAKKEFFDRCLVELERVLANYRLSEELRSKQQRLEEFRRSRGLSPEDMETISRDIKAESDYVQSIGELSKGMSESQLLDEVEHYRQRLESMHIRSQK